MPQISQFHQESGPRPIGLRRKDLWLILKSKGHNVRQDLPITVMAEIAEAEGVPYREYTEPQLEDLRRAERRLIKEHFGAEQAAPPPPAPIAGNGKADKELPPLGEQLRALSWKDLRKLAKNQGLLSPKDNREKLIAKLLGEVNDANAA